MGKYDKKTRKTSKKRNKPKQSIAERLLKSVTRTWNKVSGKNARAKQRREQKQAIIKLWELSGVSNRSSWDDINHAVKVEKRRKSVEKTRAKKMDLLIGKGAKPEIIKPSWLDKLSFKDIPNVSPETFPQFYEPLPKKKISGKIYICKQWLYVGYHDTYGAKDIRFTAQVYGSMSDTAMLRYMIRDRVAAANAHIDSPNGRPGAAVAFTFSDLPSAEHLANAYTWRGYQTAFISNRWTKKGALISLATILNSIPLDFVVGIYKTFMDYFHDNALEIYDFLKD